MLKVTCYKSRQMIATDVYMVRSIDAMPTPEEITDDDRISADGIMLHLVLPSKRCFMKPDGSKSVLFEDMFISHSLLISIEEV